MKKFLAMTLAVVIFASAIVTVSAASFPDVTEQHWAYSYVMRLADIGTVNGMPDGTFAPQGTVSRAEFVKMLGKSNVRAEGEFNDVPESHWAYDYIMYSGLEPDANNNFNPSAVITRGEVANLLYKRFANGAKVKAPYYIASQGDNADAVSWVYNTGLMLGADMLNLRLDDGLTRAEAAVLIVKAMDLDPAKTNSFIDNFSDETYKAIYEGLNIFDSAYVADEGITYEELSAASLRYQYKQRNPAIRYVFEKKYDGPYAHYWNIMCTNPLDAKGYGSTQTEANKLATVEDAIAIITHGAKYNDYLSSSMVKADGNTYADVNAKEGTQFQENMSYAYNFGISLYADGKINAKATITKKEIACIYMQYGLTFGDHILLHCGYDAQYIPMKVRRDKNSYPANADYYKYILEEIPNNIYETPYAFTGEELYKPFEFEGFAFLHANMFYKPLMYISAGIYEKGGDIYIDYHPSLIMSVKDMGEMYRVRIDVKKAFDGMMLSDIAKLGDSVEDMTLNAGDSFWCDLATNVVRKNTYIDYTLFTVEQVIR